jgi:hypothetical protein
MIWQEKIFSLFLDEVDVVISVSLMPIRKTPRKNDGEVSDPFADTPAALATPTVAPVQPVASTHPVDIYADFAEWLTTPSGIAAGNLDSLIEVMSQGNYVRSKLSLHKRMMIAFEAGRRAL